MVVSRDLVVLGRANDLHFVNDAGVKFFVSLRGDDYGLFSNHEGSAVYLLPLKSPKTAPIVAGRKKGKILYRKWHGFDMDMAVKFNIPDSAATLYKCGYAVAVIYTSDKWEKKPRKYIHEFTGKVRTYCDRKKDPRVFGLMDVSGKKLVTERGIVG